MAATQQQIDNMLRAAKEFIAAVEGPATPPTTGSSPGGMFDGVKPGGWANTMLPKFESERLANLAKPAPFGRYPDETPKTAPAYDKCKALWEAAQRVPTQQGEERLFWIFNYLPGIQGLSLGGVPSPAPKYLDDQQKLEDDIVALAKTPFGKAWLSVPTNAAMIDRDYQVKFLGYYITQKSNNPDDGVLYHSANGTVIA